ncbi:phosphonate C-P lyase system protein PhnG [Ruminococcus sp.]|uniref:phosphonate C-P lyase system protein PhnG n=1 Tax=Ruminococcus sp. TaxID=41978 RepID=UPI0025E6A3AE|nr:phosphonate C-P lyase system protein PhnG [Ruminococcus sp.]
MEKKQLFQILARADREDVIALGAELQQIYPVMIVKKPEKSLTMIQMREPVKQSMFYLGEVIVTEATVSLDGTVGTAVTMGDDFDKTLHMAIIDAAENKGVFQKEELLLEWETQQMQQLEQENAMFQKTKVDFHSMDSGVVQ